MANFAVFFACLLVVSTAAQCGGNISPVDGWCCKNSATTFIAPQINADKCSCPGDICVRVDSASTSGTQAKGCSSNVVNFPGGATGCGGLGCCTGVGTACTGQGTSGICSALPFGTSVGSIDGCCLKGNIDIDQVRLTGVETDKDGALTRIERLDNKGGVVTFGSGGITVASKGVPGSAMTLTDLIAAATGTPAEEGEDAEVDDADVDVYTAEHEQGIPSAANRMGIPSGMGIPSIPSIRSGAGSMMYSGASSMNMRSGASSMGIRSGAGSMGHVAVFGQSTASYHAAREQSGTISFETAATSETTNGTCNPASNLSPGYRSLRGNGRQLYDKTARKYNKDCAEGYMCLSDHNEAGTYTCQQAY